MARVVDDAMEKGTATYPEARVDRQQLETFLAERGLAEGSVEHAADLFLVAACLGGDARALAVLERRFLAEVPRYVAKIERDPAAVGELQQLVREKLLVASGGVRPRLAEYTGRGSLGAFLRVVSVRIALDAKRARSAEIPTAEVPEVSVGADPELDYLRIRYAERFREAFQHALGTLDARTRAVLRMNVVDGLPIDRIGVAYDVHRATVARWIADARVQLLEETRRHLASTLSLGHDELDSVVRLVGTDLDASVRRILTEE